MKGPFSAAAAFAVLLGAGAAPAVEVHVSSESNPKQDAYVLAIDDTTMTASASTDTIVAVRDAWSGDFLWFRRHGKAYIARDRAIVDEVRALFAPLEALRPEQRALDQRDRDLEREEQALDHERDSIEDSRDAGDDESSIEDSRDTDDDEGEAVRPPRTRADEERLEELASRMAELRSRERALDAQQRELDARTEETERRTEAKLWRRIDGWIADGAAKPAADPARR